MLFSQMDHTFLNEESILIMIMGVTHPVPALILYLVDQMQRPPGHSSSGVMTTSAITSRYVCLFFSYVKSRSTYEFTEYKFATLRIYNKIVWNRTTQLFSEYMFKIYTFSAHETMSPWYTG